MKKTQRLLTTIISLLLVFSLFISTGAVVYADNTVYNAPKLTNNDVFFKNSIPTNANGASSVGGITVGTANNRLFALKAKEGDVRKATLYYYSNIYSSSTPKQIKFHNYLLGHANSVAPDNDYLYVTGWQQEGPYKNRIMRISRAAISACPNNYTVNYNSSTDWTPDGVNIVRNIDGTNYNILKEIRPKKADGSNYTYEIRCMTRFHYDTTNNIVKFFIDYNPTDTSNLPFNLNQGIAYTVATLQNGVLTVSEAPKDIFFIKTSGIQYTVGNSNTINNLSYTTKQDIFYEPNYGLYIPVWNSNSATISIVLRVNMSPYLQTHTDTLLIDPSKLTVFDFSGTDTQFEIESLAFVKKDSNMNPTLKVVVGANTLQIVDGVEKGRDCYCIMNNSGNLLSSF